MLGAIAPAIRIFRMYHGQEATTTTLGTSNFTNKIQHQILDGQAATASHLGDH